MYHSIPFEAFCITVVFLGSGLYHISGTQVESQERRGECERGLVLSDIIYILCTLSVAHHKHHIII